MILNEVPASKAEFFNVNSEVIDFKMNTSAKAFQILSTQIYSNNIKAIIRELSTNAYDSHVEAGKADVPFEVHLPTVLNPYFSVKDYGVGLSEDQIEKVYTTYFESTKTHSDLFNGQLGLGSKSPFSYTDNFTITSVKDGVKSVYTAFINDRATNSLVKMSSAKTEDPNGVEIRFAVDKKEDYEKFQFEATNTLQWFENIPTVFGYNKNDGKIKSGLAAYSHIKDSIYKTTSGNLELNLVMGNICYPVDSGKLKEFGLSIPIRFNVKLPIGSFDFTPSREGLQYTKKTNDAIRSIVENILDYYKQIVGNLRKQHANSDWEFNQAVHELRKTADGNFAVNEWEKTHKSILAYIYRKDLPNTNIEFFDCFDNVTITDCVGYSKNNIVLVNCPDKCTNRKILKHNYEDNNIIWIPKADNLQDILKKLGNPPKSNIVEYSSLNKPPAKKRVVNNFVAYSLKPRTRSYVEEYVFEPYCKDSDGKKYYVPVKGFAWDKGSIKHVMRLFKHVMRLFKHIDEFKKIHVVCVKQDHINQIIDDPEWIDLEKYVQEVYDKFLVTPFRYKTNNSWMTADVKNITSKISKDSDFHKLFNFDSNTITKDNLRALIPVIHCFEINDKKLVERIKEYDQFSEKLSEKYAMIDYCNKYQYDEKDIKKIVDYINLVDGKV